MLDFHNWDFWGPKILLAVEMRRLLFSFDFDEISSLEVCSLENKGPTDGYFQFLEEHVLVVQKRQWL